MTHERQTRLVSHRSEGEKPSVTNDAHVSKVVGALHESRHVAAHVEVINGVGKDGDTGAPAAQKRAPPPLVVLGGELKVCQRNRRERHDEDENDEDDE